jgi:hypothetical protein
MRSDRLGPACLALLIVTVIGCLMPIAAASSPDPSWVRGLYDGANFDDIVGLITPESGLLGELAREGFRHDLVVIGVVPTTGDDPVVSLSLASPPPRAPPAS